MVEGKPITKAKTFWAGLGVTLLGVVGVALEVWAAFGPEEMEALDKVFGPTTMSVIGIIFIVLRVVTRDAVRWSWR